MIILDSKVTSERAKERPHEGVLNWADSVHGPTIATTAITVAELFCGVARLPDGRRKSILTDAVRQLVDVDLVGRAYPFEICRSRGAILATTNTKDFTGTGIKLINPFQVGP